MSENRQMAVVGHLDALRVNTAQGLIAREVGGIAEFHNHLESDLRIHGLISHDDFKLAAGVNPGIIGGDDFEHHVTGVGDGAAKQIGLIISEITNLIVSCRTGIFLRVGGG